MSQIFDDFGKMLPCNYSGPLDAPQFLHIHLHSQPEQRQKKHRELKMWRVLNTEGGSCQPFRDSGYITKSPGHWLPDTQSLSSHKPQSHYGQQCLLLSPSGMPISGGLPGLHSLFIYLPQRKGGPQKDNKYLFKMSAQRRFIYFLFFNWWH